MKQNMTEEKKTIKNENKIWNARTYQTINKRIKWIYKN